MRITAALRDMAVAFAQLTLPKNPTLRLIVSGVLTPLAELFSGIHTLTYLLPHNSTQVKGGQPCDAIFFIFKSLVKAIIHVALRQPVNAAL